MKSGLKNVRRFHFDAKSGDTVQMAISSGDRMGYVITVAKTPIKAKESALNAIKTIKLSYVNN